MVSFLLSFVRNNSILFEYCLVWKPLCISLFSYFDLWSEISFFLLFFFRSLIGNIFFCFSSDLWPRTFFLQHTGSLTLNGSSLLGTSFHSSSSGARAKVPISGQSWSTGSGTLALWNSRTWRMSGYGLGQRFRDKGMSHIISMTRTQQWRFRISCKTGHACTHVDTQASNFVVMWH